MDKESELKGLDTRNDRQSQYALGSQCIVGK